MLDKLFNNQKFLFIFSFCLEFGFYYFVEYATLGGPYYSNLNSINNHFPSSYDIFVHIGKKCNYSSK